MDEFKILYDSIENPIDNKQTWDLIIDIYSKSLSYDDFFDKIVNTSNKNTNTSVDNIEKENFYIYIWNIWQRSILESVDKKVPIIDIKELKEVLKENKVVDFTSLQEILKNPLVSRYFMRALNSDKFGNITISSYFSKDKAHLSYMISLNIDAKNIYKISKYLIQSCIEKGLPYFIRLTEKNNCDDTFNVYVEKSTIDEYLSIINRIRKENSYLTNRLNPPLLMGKIKGLYGICSSSINDKESYNKLRTKILMNALDGVMCNYIYKNIDRVISYKGNKIPVKKFVSMFAADNEVDKLIENSSDEIKKYYSKNWEEVNKLKDTVQNELLNIIDNILYKDLREYTNEDIIKITINTNETIEIPLTSFLIAIRRLAPVLIYIDKELNEIIKERIINECNYVKVDSKKFCFNKSSLEMSSKATNKKELITKKLAEIKKITDIIDETKLLRQQDNINDDTKKKISNNIKEIIRLIEESNKKENI